MATPAHARARPADALAALRQRAAGCRECPLGALATRTAWDGGAPRARRMHVDEQPGDREDQVGRPFVGPAAHLLDHAFATLGWLREALHRTSAVKRFKYELRGKRRLHKPPGPLETLACAHWPQDEIDAIEPAGIVALGGTAARSLLGRPVKILSERGRWLERPDGIGVLVTLHPSALLRGDPRQREKTFASWVDDLRGAVPLLPPH